MSPAEALAAAAAVLDRTVDARLLAVLGDPVGHSLSPRLHAAALAHAGLPHRYVAVRCSGAELPVALRALRALPTLGANLTAPLKEVALPLLDALDPLAAAIGAVNTLVRDGRRFVGHNTDADGFLDALAEAGAPRPEGAHALILGAGGAARAVVAALLQSGVDRVTLVVRSRPRANRLVADLGALCPETRFDVMATPDGAPEDVDLVVQCTPVGLDALEDTPAYDEALGFFGRLPWGAWSGRAVACDLNYRPTRTAFLALAELTGCMPVGGLGMLVHQAARAFALWTGKDGPVEAMRAAVR